MKDSGHACARLKCDTLDDSAGLCRYFDGLALAGIQYELEVVVLNPEETTTEAVVQWELRSYRSGPMSWDTVLDLGSATSFDILEVIAEFVVVYPSYSAPTATTLQLESLGELPSVISRFSQDRVREA